MELGPIECAKNCVVVTKSRIHKFVNVYFFGSRNKGNPKM